MAKRLFWRLIKILTGVQMDMEAKLTRLERFAFLGPREAQLHTQLLSGAHGGSGCGQVLAKPNTRR